MTRLLLYHTDKDLFGRLHIAANTQQINLKEALCYELSPISCALAHQDTVAACEKTHNSITLTTTEKEVNVVEHLKVSYHVLAIF